MRVQAEEEDVIIAQAEAILQKRKEQAAARRPQGAPLSHPSSFSNSVAELPFFDHNVMPYAPQKPGVYSRRQMLEESSKVRTPLPLGISWRKSVCTWRDVRVVPMAWHSGAYPTSIGCAYAEGHTAGSASSEVAEDAGDRYVRNCWCSNGTDHAHPGCWGHVPGLAF